MAIYNYEKTAPSLDERHRTHLLGSAISEEIINQRGYTTIENAGQWRYTAGEIHSEDMLRRVLKRGALAFPLYQVAAPTPYTWILRPDQPRTAKDGKIIKYEYPRHVANVLDILPSYQTALADPQIPIWITEGCKKADALATAFGSKIVPINENGVWGWRSGGEVLGDFKRILWEGRRVVIAPDGDVRYNPHVYAAVQRSAKMFTALGAKEVLICLLPQAEGGRKTALMTTWQRGTRLMNSNRIWYPRPRSSKTARRT
jgi:hypothetical protein